MITLFLIVALIFFVYVGVLLFLVKLGFAALKILLSGGVGMVILVVIIFLLIFH